MEFFNDVRMHPPDDLHIIYEDEYEQPEEEMFEYDYEDFLQSQMPPSFNEIFQSCILPTIEQANGHIGKLIVCCIIFRISTQLCKFKSFLKYQLSKLELCNLEIFCFQYKYRLG